METRTLDGVIEEIQRRACDALQQKNDRTRNLAFHVKEACAARLLALEGVLELLGELKDAESNRRHARRPEEWEIVAVWKTPEVKGLQPEPTSYTFFKEFNAREVAKALRQSGACVSVRLYRKILEDL